MTKLIKYSKIVELTYSINNYNIISKPNEFVSIQDIPICIVYCS